jgi:alanine racemase
MLSTQAEQAGALLTIDLAAICSNYRLLRERLGRTECAAVVKADGYGLGAARVAPALAASGCRHFFVAHLDEAIALRPRLPETALYVLHGSPPGVEQAFVSHRLIPVLNSLQQIDGWTAAARAAGRALPAIVQVDSGMSRLGLSPHELTALADDPRCLDGIEIKYVMSHLACAEQQDQAMNAEQLTRFAEARRRLPEAPASFANSSGIFLGADYHFDLARPGAALYGVAPIAGEANPMQQVVRLQGKVIQVRTVEPGARVGYGGTYRAPSTRRIATVSVGYADGYLRSLSNRANVYVGETAAPLVGIVSMDTITVDATELPALEPGSLVDLINDRHPVDALAQEAGTIGYEILTSLGGRYYRQYLGG